MRAGPLERAWSWIMIWLFSGTFLPVALLLAWVLYTDLQIKRQHQERQDDE